MSYCAICTSERGPFTQQPLGKGDAFVSVCGDCDEPAFERHGPERGYEPNGGLLTQQQATDGIVRALGKDENARQLRIVDVHTRTTTPARTEADADLAVMDFENLRRIRVHRNTWAPNGRRAK